MKDRKEPKMKQQTKPKKGKPMEIPVPKRSAFDRLLTKAEKPARGTHSADEDR